MSEMFAVKGTLRMLQKGHIDLDQAVEIFNMWIELSTKRGYAEGITDGLRRNKVTQDMRDMGM